MRRCHAIPGTRSPEPCSNRRQVKHNNSQYQGGEGRDLFKCARKVPPSPPLMATQMVLSLNPLLNPICQSILYPFFPIPNFRCLLKCSIPIPLESAPLGLGRGGKLFALEEVTMKVRYHGQEFGETRWRNFIHLRHHIHLDNKSDSNPQTDSPSHAVTIW